ncbi:MAG TPA: hypothetical protein VMW17_09915 [Candidatus Binatia bacterium]|nr:hypothetical protein [Candidatus Binatia bacterium]
MPTRTVASLLMASALCLPPAVSAVDCDGRNFERVSVGSFGESNGGSLIPFASADGCVVGFKSDATNLVGSDSNQRTDVFVRDRVNGLTIRVSANENGVEANDGNFPPALSSGGQVVAFGSFADNLVFGDSNGFPDMFVVNRTAGTVERVDLGVNGSQANDGVPDLPPSLSADGRLVAFTSSASNLVPFPQDFNEAPDVFVYDRDTGNMELITRDLIHSSAPGNAAELGGSAPALSQCPASTDTHPCTDGRFVAFVSSSTALVRNDTNGARDVFVWDRQEQSIDRVSVGSDGRQANLGSQPSGYPPAISDDGRFVAFASDATNLVDGDDNGVTDVFIRDRLAGTTIRIEPPSGCTTGGAAAISASGASDAPSISADGRFVAFKSLASNFVSGDTNNRADIFVFDRTTRLVARVLGDGNVEPNGDSNFPHISADGQWITFQSDASNLVSDDTNGKTDIFIAVNPFLSGEQIPGVTPLPVCTDTPTVTPTSCVPNGCPSGLVCVEDLCVTPTPSPTPTSCNNTGCPSGQVCVMDKCVTPTPTSCNNTGCPSGQICVMDKCVTPTPSPTPTSCNNTGCPSGQICVMDKCVTPTPGCTLTSDCPPPQVCIAGMCKPPGQCDSDDDCGPGERCDVPSMTCVTKTPTRTITATPSPTKKSGGGGGGGCSCRVDPRVPGNDETAAALGLPVVLWLLRRRGCRSGQRVTTLSD